MNSSETNNTNTRYGNVLSNEVTSDNPNPWDLPSVDQDYAKHIRTMIPGNEQFMGEQKETTRIRRVAHNIGQVAVRSARTVETATIGTVIGTALILDRSFSEIGRNLPAARAKVRENLLQGADTAASNLDVSPENPVRQQLAERIDSAQAAAHATTEPDPRSPLPPNPWQAYRQIYKNKDTGNQSTGRIDEINSRLAAAREAHDAGDYEVAKAHLEDAKSLKKELEETASKKPKRLGKVALLASKVVSPRRRRDRTLARAEQAWVASGPNDRPSTSEIQYNQ